jgi:hypothetical protein
MGPTVAVACDPTIDCRMREVRGTRQSALTEILPHWAPGVHFQRGPTSGMIILVAEDSALSRELIRELLEGSGQVAEKLGFQQIFWYCTKLTDLHAQRPPIFG